MGPQRLILQPSLAMTLALLIAAASLVNSQSLPGCQSKCGDVDIPYPFGFGDENCHREGFDLVCNDTRYNPPRPFIGDYEILSIDLLQAELRTRTFVARDCFNRAGTRLNTGIMSADLDGGPFSFSDRRNRFTVTGCDTLVYLNDPSGFGFATGCVSVCNNMTLLMNGICSGIGCCQTAIPRGLKYFQTEFRSFNNHTNVWSFNPCSYAFVSEDDSFVFNTSFLAADYTYQVIQMPAILDWAIEGNNCTTAKENLTSYACRSANSVCLPSNSGLGYICNCSYGYRGNPYISDGCQDVDECNDPNSYPCKGDCVNLPGNYSCICPPGTHASDPKIEECTSSTTSGREFPLFAKWLIGVGSSLCFLLLIVSWFHWGSQKRRLIQERHRFFEQNGGFLLRQFIFTERANSFKIFEETELQRATENFHHVLGRGGNGTVYKGILDCGRVVAIKVPTRGKETEGKKDGDLAKKRTEDFANEMVALAKISHRNVVKLLGCCLEIELPMLVYDYIPNGTLSQFIRDTNNQIPLGNRLRIAKEAAKAFAYMHEAHPPIIHGDVKSSNILLGKQLEVVISDFGTSIFAHSDIADTEATSLQGTPGYIAPEYMATGKLTPNCDVYSFGVVLVELLTREAAICSTGPYKGSSLREYFISSRNNDKLSEILDSQLVEDVVDQKKKKIVEDGSLPKKLQEACNLAAQCLSFSAEDRPTMLEIVMVLETITRSDEQHSVRPVPQEASPSVPGEAANTQSFRNTAGLTFEIEKGEMMAIKQSGR